MHAAADARRREVVACPDWSAAGPPVPAPSCRDLRIDHEHVGREAGHRHAREVVDGVVRHAGHDRRHRRLGGVDQQRVAIWRGAGDGLGPITLPAPARFSITTAWPRVWLGRLGDDAAHDVVGSAGREGTTRRIGRVGRQAAADCACTADGARPAARARVWRRVVMDGVSPAVGCAVSRHGAPFLIPEQSGLARRGQPRRRRGVAGGASPGGPSPGRAAAMRRPSPRRWPRCPHGALRDGWHPAGSFTRPSHARSSAGEGQLSGRRPARCCAGPAGAPDARGALAARPRRPGRGRDVCPPAPAARMGPAATARPPAPRPA